MGDVSAAGAIEDFVSIGDHGGKAVLGLVYMEIQDFARFTGTIGIFAVDIAYVILVDQAFAIGIDEGGNAYILRLKIEDHLVRPGLAILTAHLEKGASLLMVIVIGISANFHLIAVPIVADSHPCSRRRCLGSHWKRYSKEHGKQHGKS